MSAAQRPHKNTPRVQKVNMIEAATTTSCPLQYFRVCKEKTVGDCSGNSHVGVDGPGCITDSVVILFMLIFNSLPGCERKIVPIAVARSCANYNGNASIDTRRG